MTDKTNNSDQKANEAPKGMDPAPNNNPSSDATSPAQLPTTEEFNGRKGPDPTRYGDWEKNGRCIDF